MHWAYHSWLSDAAQLADRLHRERRFDLVHQLTYVGFRFPGQLWKLDAPFVWGPIGGLNDMPWRLFGALEAGGKLYYAAYNMVNLIQRRFLRAPRRAALRAGPGLIAATRDMAVRIEQAWGLPSRVISEVTAPTGMTSRARHRKQGEPIRLLWSGVHLPRKALPLLLKALAGLGSGTDWHLTILGRGPCTASWQRDCQRLGLSQRCDWRGQLPRAAALKALADAHLFVITSLNDLTSTVLVEALGLGVPVLCPDHCGFSDAVTVACGRRLAIRSPRGFVAALRSSILELEQDEALRRRLADGARCRAEAFTAQAKQADIADVYRCALEERQARRDRFPTAQREK